MKKLLCLLCILFMIAGCMHQSVSISGEDALKAGLDSVFRWDVEKQQGGALMFLDVPYVRETDCDTRQADYLSLSVAIYDSKPRPGWIAIILPDNIDREQGVSLFFKKSDMLDEPLAENDSTETSIRANLENSSQETFTTRFKNGFTIDEKKRQVDIFQKFMDSDILYLMVFYANGDHKTISVPLEHFKKQYADLSLKCPIVKP